MKTPVDYSWGKYFKKSIPMCLLCFGLLTIPIGVQAQFMDNLAYGPIASLTISKFTNDQPHTGANIGFAAGGFARYQVLDFLYAELDIMYMQQGGTRLTVEDMSIYNNGIARKTMTSQVALHYLEIPALARFDAAEFLGWSPSIKPFAIAGPALGVKLGAWDRRDITYELTRTVSNGIYGEVPVTVTTVDQENVSKEYETINFGVYVGGGGEIDLNGRTLMLDLRYRFGITPVNKTYNELNRVANADDFRTNVIALTVGLTW